MKKAVSHRARRGPGEISFCPVGTSPIGQKEDSLSAISVSSVRDRLGCFLLILAFVFVIADMAHGLPSYEEVKKTYVKSDVLLLDRRGEVLHELRVDKGRRRLDWTSLGNISPALQHAVVQAEDKRFFYHGGVDYRSIGAAIIQGLTSESFRGASTLTMQLASFLDPSLQSPKGRRSFWQKERQVIEAWEIEKSWSKEEILEAYLNLITFRGELQGIAAASRGLFGKDPHGLDETESLILASFIRSPNASPKEVIRRASNLALVLKWQVDGEEIESKVREIYLGPNTLRPKIALAPHIARQLLPGQGNGLPVSCTLDSKIQRFALDRLTHALLPLRSQNVRDGAILVVENETGDVLAYVSHSGEPNDARYVDGVQAKRQAGSSLKPFLYGLAFESRILTPASLLDDSPLDLAVLNGVYQPRNYDSQFRGQVTTRVALASSLNVPAVRTLSLVGTESFLVRLRQLGFKGLHESGDFYGPSLALGSSDVSLWELVNGYRTLANDGLWSELHLVLGKRSSAQPRRVFSKEAVFLVSDILSDRDARSITFGLENPLATRFWTAVKTGTSKDMRDNWCVGYSKRYTAGVWVGNFSGEPMWNVSGVTGAAPIWIEIMNYLHRRDDLRIMPPSTVVSQAVRSSRVDESLRREWFIQGTEPNSKEQKTGQFNQRIVYPPCGSVIALDPDIPPDLQRVFFISQRWDNNLHWKLNGEALDRAGKAIPWSPVAGKYVLAITDSEDKVLDAVSFEVRGPGDSQRFESENE